MANMLRLSGKNPKYYYFQDENELPYLVHLFRQSQYRYLHFSSHGEPNEILTTNGSISYMRFAAIFKRHLILRRMFFSACELGNDLFTEVLAGSNNGMHSIAAPIHQIYFHDAAAIWNVLYLSLFQLEGTKMKHRQIIEKLIAIRKLFPVDFHFSGYNSNTNKWHYHTIDAAYKLENFPIKPVQATHPKQQGVLPQKKKSKK